MRTAAKEQKLFGRYTLKRVLGRGGMGIVWLAHDDELIRYVAMKFLPDMLVRDREAVEDLKRETRRSLDLTHHHIVRIYDFTQDEMCAAIIMEFVDGETLSAMKTQQPGGCFGVSQIAPWVAHFASALDYAHRQARVIHRDLKPANLMINSRGDLKVTDFGISRSMSDSMTRVSVSNTAGTLAYMSPEQALGAPPAPGDDIYAFGATVYDLLTGRPPFFRGNLQVQLETVIPPRMEDRRAELGNSAEPIPALWQDVIASCLAKRPQDRPQSIADVAALLGLGGTSSGSAPIASSGSTISVPSGTTQTRAHRTEDSATEGQQGSATPRTSQPSTNRPTSGPRPTGLDDILAATSIREEIVSPQARVTAAPGREGGSSQTIPPEDLTLHAQKPLAPEPAAAASQSANQTPASKAAAEESSPATFAVEVDRTPERKSPSSLAIAALGSLVLVAATAAWMFLRPAPEPAAKVEPVPPIATPAPNYDVQIAAIRDLIQAESLARASELIAELPANLDAIDDLKIALAAKQTLITKREEDARKMAERTQAIAELFKASDSAFEKKDWVAARIPLQRIRNEYDAENSDAATKLAAIDAAAEKMAKERDEEALRNVLAGANAALATGDHAKAKDIFETAPSSQAGNPELVALASRIEKARIDAMTPPSPPPPVEPPKTTKTTSASSKPKTSTTQTNRPTRRDDDDSPRKSSPSRTSERPPQPVVAQKKESPQPPAPVTKKRPSSVNRGTAPGG